MPSRARWILLAALLSMVAPTVVGGGCSESHRLPASGEPSEEHDAATADSAPPVVTKDGAADTGQDAEVAEEGEWIPLPGLGICFGERLNLKKASWPKRVWESCGTGCRVGPASVLPDHVGISFASGAKLFQGDLYYRASVLGKSDSYEELWRLSDDEPLLVIRLDGQCYVSAAKEDAPFVLEVSISSGTDDPPHSWVGLFDPTTSVLTVPSGLILTSAPTAWFSWDHGWGVMDGGQVSLNYNPSGTDLTTVYSSPTWKYPAPARGDLLVWADAGGGACPIRSFTKAGGVKLLVPSAWNDIPGLAHGENVLAWVGAHGPNAFLGKYDAIELYWSPVAKDPSGITVTQGPSLTGMLAGPVPMAVAGDYIALSNSGTKEDFSQAGTHVVKMSTGQMWFIHARPGTTVELAGMTESELLIMEHDAKNYSEVFQYLRLDLSQLDALAAAWAPP